MSSEPNYSIFDRLVHRIAFSSRSVQLVAADIESSIFAKRFQNIVVEKPIFITSLPRAGTTLLLEMLDQCTGTATHRYRDMPFVLAPMLWEQCTGNFRKSVSKFERAHGDGVLVGFDSPEAFEEVAWRYFWPENYNPDGIDLWNKDGENEEFRDFLFQHIQKIIALRCNDEHEKCRYISKNNANIARIDLLKKQFPDSEILIPIRNPLAHAKSLLRQHVNFLERHQLEGFSKRYMNDIGHLEFGKLQRVIRFEEAQAMLGEFQPLQLEYWLAYWIAAYEHIIKHHEQVILLSYDDMCKPGSNLWDIVSIRLDIPHDENWNDAKLMIKTSVAQTREEKEVDQVLLDRANTLYDRVLKLCIS